MKGLNYIVDKSQADKSKPHRKPSVGICLGGGGARGLAHIGVLKALSQNGIQVDCLAGTSMGGIIAAGYAYGMSPAELEQEATATTRLRKMLRLADPGLPDMGLLRGKRLLHYFESQLEQRTFAELDLPLALVAVDLNSRREIILREGPVALALRATTAVPGLFTPLELDGRRLVDGGLLNNLPVDAARQLGADVVIAVDVEPGPDEQPGGWIGGYHWIPEGLTRTLSILEESIGLVASVIQDDKLRQYPPDVLIRPRIPSGVNILMGYGRVAELVAVGECAAEEALPKIKCLLRQRQILHPLLEGEPQDRLTKSRDKPIIMESDNNPDAMSE